MAKRCVFRLDMDQGCKDMDIDTFRSFVLEQCIPPMWECVGKMKPLYRTIDTTLDESVRGSGSVYGEADSSGDWKVGGKLTWDF